jgi:hypothetical protein
VRESENRNRVQDQAPSTSPTGWRKWLGRRDASGELHDPSEHQRLEWSSLLSHGRLQLELLEHNSARVGSKLDRAIHKSPSPEILLSLRVLFDTIDCVYSGNRSIGSNAICSNSAVCPSLLPLYRHLTPDRRWCPKQATYLCQTFSIPAL